MAWRTTALAVFTLALLGCENSAEIIGTVRDIDDARALGGVAVGYGQDIDGELIVREEFTATTGSQGGYLLTTELGPFSRGYVLFFHEDYFPDTVEFFGADVGQRVRVDVNLVVLSDTAAVDTADGITGP